MARITCEYCNTEYESDMEQCPLCGMPNSAAGSEQPDRPREERTQTAERKITPKKKRTGARAKPAEDKIPRWIYILISVFLSLAVLIGSLYAMYAVGIIKFGGDKNKKDESLDLPIQEDDPGPEPAPEPEPKPEPEPEPVACTGLSLKEEIVLTEVGGLANVELRVEPENCTEAVSLVSSNPAVCTVDADGQVTALGEGRAVITAACGEQTGTVQVICDFGGGTAGEALALSSGDVTLLAAGESAALTVRGLPDGAEVIWSSGDEDVCTVEDGVITAQGPGVADVTAEVDGQRLTCTVRCRFEDGGGAPSGGGANRLDHTDVTLKPGESFEISVVDGISGGWNVTDGSVITVDGNGIVTGIAKGTASVYTVVGGERLECIVRVT